MVTEDATSNPWVGWLRAMLQGARDASLRAVLEESALPHLLDPAECHPIVVLDPDQQRADVWFVQAGRQIHAGHINARGEWICAAAAPAREPSDSRPH